MQDLNARNLQNQKPSDDDNPSAPPFSGATGEIKQDAEHIPAFRAQCMPSEADARGFSKPNSLERKSPIVNPQNNIRQEIPDVSVRFVWILYSFFFCKTVCKETYVWRNIDMLLDAHMFC